MNISSQVLNSAQYFSINGQALSGVDNISIGYNNPMENSPVLGGAGFGYLLNAPIEGSIDVSRQLLYNDPLINFTGDISFSGSFNYGDKSYSFASGYLNSYSVSCGVGEIPQVSARISVYSSLRSGSFVNHQEISTGLFIPSPRSISISGLDFATNRIKGFNYSYSISRQPIYSIEGGRSASSVNFIGPINVSASVDMDASNSYVFDSYKVVESFSPVSFNINMKDRRNDSTIIDFTMPNCELIGESLRSSSDGQPIKSLSFAGFIA